MNDSQSPPSETLSQIEHIQSREPALAWLFSLLALVPGGFSEPFKRLAEDAVHNRMKGLNEILIAEMRRGAVTTEALIDRDLMISFILRVGRAAAEGTSREKLKMIAQYFFRHVAEPEALVHSFGDFVAVTEQLTESDMRALAVFKRAKLEGYFDRPSEISGENNGQPQRRLRVQMDMIALFRSDMEFDEAVLALSRFGFIRLASAFGGMAYFATDRLLQYLDALDLEGLGVPEKS